MMDKIPMSKDIVDQYNLCYSNVEQHFGKSVKLVLPVQLGADQDFQPAIVDVKELLTSLRLMKQWDAGSNKLWTLIKNEQLDEKIFCQNLSASGTPTSQSNAKAINDLKIKIGSDPTYFKTAISAVHGTVDDDDNEDDTEDPPEEEIEDDLLPEESALIHSCINQTIAKATTAETKVKLTGKQFRIKRLRSKKAFEEDSVKKTMRSTNMFRQKLNATSIGVANIWKKEKPYTHSSNAPMTKTPRDPNELKPGRTYTMSGYTIRFAIKEHRKTSHP